MKKSTALRIFLVALLCLAVVLFFSHTYLLRQVGHFLVFERTSGKADFILILNGRPTERCLEAVDLYQKKLADTIVMASLMKQPGSDEFWHRVGESFRCKGFSERALEAMGIPETAIVYIGDGVNSTYDEAKAAQRFIGERGGQSIIIVTSKWHSKRTFLTFKTVFKDKRIDISIYPSPYDTFNPDTWWKSETGVELVFREYLRLLYYVLTGRITFF
jgi:uncharacterized SAM-binding protein YcdF (DUF218 family)